MSAGGWHLAGSVMVASAVVAAGHLDARPLEVTVAALAGGLGPDLDSGASAMGSLIPQWIAPDAIGRDGRFERRLFGVLPLKHRGPTHSYLVGAAIAAALGWTWLRAALHPGLGWLILQAALSQRPPALPPPDLGLLLGLTFLLAWVLHLRMDPGPKQVLWPLSGRWMR